MSSVSVNPPKTPVTEGTNGVAAATLPNVCKMPGPPAPFVPTPLPNIGKSGTSPKNYSKSVTIEGKKVAIRGATFGSMGDVASKGTGGGLVSSNVEGPTSFVGPGSMNVKFEGKNVQLLGDPMLNNCGPRGSPANAATMMGLAQEDALVTTFTGENDCPLCGKQHGALKETDQTKTDASELASMLEEKKFPLSRMIGVVHCKCKKNIYADHSSVTLEEFSEIVKNLNGWKAPPGILSIANSKGNKNKENVEKRFNETTAMVRENLLKRFSKPIQTLEVRATWAIAEYDSRLSFERRNQENPPAAAYPPGACAAQKVLVFVWDRGAYPDALTERWFSAKGEATDGLIAVKNPEHPTGPPIMKQFAHGKSVPPCENCKLIIPLMLCPGDTKEEQCRQHTD